jgi:hypothetical protein
MVMVFAVTSSICHVQVDEHCRDNVTVRLELTLAFVTERTPIFLDQDSETLDGSKVWIEQYL